mmetsp:Transcript_98103/g.245885  ORF Transcript_98103/g.245885 Transcript_98103/m.245885 type:complete len:332 (+) Transcript_98103:64-1059(+)
MVAPRSRLSFLLAAGLLKVSYGGWNPTCTGDFACSSVTSDDLELIDSFLGGDEVTCRFGHIEIDGACEWACEGTRTAPCRCQSQAEAEESLTDGAQLSLYVSISITVPGLCSSLCMLCIVSRLQVAMSRRRTLQHADGHEAPSLAAETSVDVEDGRPTDSGPADPEAEAAEPQGDNRAAPLPPPAPSPPLALTRSSGPSAFERVLERSERVAFAHPQKAKLLRWFFPLLGLGFAAWGAYELLSPLEGQFYDHLGTFLGIVGIAAAAVSLIILVFVAADSNPFLCIARMIAVAYFLLPLLGLAGIVWSLVRMQDPHGKYHACEMQHCIFGLC